MTKQIVNLIRCAAAPTLVVITALVLTLGAAKAQELSPEHVALAREYVDLTDQAKIYESTLLRAGVQTMQVIVPLNPEISEQTSDAIGRTIASYVDRKGELMDQFARVYATRFSMDELREILTFYRSPVGAKLTASNPEINHDLGAVMSVFQQNLQTEFFAKVRADLRELGIEF